MNQHILSLITNKQELKFDMKVNIKNEKLGERKLTSIPNQRQLNCIRNGTMKGNTLKTFLVDAEGILDEEYYRWGKFYSSKTIS